MRRTPNPQTARPVFIEALSRCGCVTAAARAANVSRASVYAWKAVDPAFSDAWEEALALGVAGLEDKALEYAFAGSEKLIMFILQARKPEVYGRRSTVEFSRNVLADLRHTPLDALRAELVGFLAGNLPTEAAALSTPLDQS